MRTLRAAILVAAFSLLRATPALASCAPPSSVADNAARAVAVVQGTVTAVSGGALTVRVSKVFKGSVGATVRIFVGPGRGIGATSADYSAQAGTEHTLYLITGADGQLETNACIGSHAGAATADELAQLGPGSSPSGSSSDGTSAQPFAFEPEPSLLWLAVAAAAVATAFFVLRVRRAL